MAGEEFFEWQGRQEDRRRQGSRHPALKSPRHGSELAPAPPERDMIDVQEHHASTTIVRRIRLALFKNQRSE